MDYQTLGVSHDWLHKIMLWWHNWVDMISLDACLCNFQLGFLVSSIRTSLYLVSLKILSKQGFNASIKDSIKQINEESKATKLILYHGLKYADVALIMIRG